MHKTNRTKKTFIISLQILQENINCYDIIDKIIDRLNELKNPRAKCILFDFSVHPQNFSIVFLMQMKYKNNYSRYSNFSLNDILIAISRIVKGVCKNYQLYLERTIYSQKPQSLIDYTK